MEEITSPYDKDMVDESMIDPNEIRLNPDEFMRNAILKAQACLGKDNVMEGFLQFRMFIEQLEVLCRAAAVLPEGYDDMVNAFKESQEYKDAEPKIKSVLLGHKKEELLLMSAFRDRPLYGVLKIGTTTYGSKRRMSPNEDFRPPPPPDSPQEKEESKEVLPEATAKEGLTNSNA